MTGTSLDAFPERSVAMVRAFSPVLERALLISGVIAGVIGILMMPLIADRVPDLLGPPVTALIGAVVGVAAGFVSVPRPLRRAFEVFGGVPKVELVNGDGAVPGELRDRLTAAVTLPSA